MYENFYRPNLTLYTLPYALYGKCMKIFTGLLIKVSSGVFNFEQYSLKAYVSNQKFILKNEFFTFKSIKICDNDIL